jgi:hypothetical protein
MAPAHVRQAAPKASVVTVGCPHFYPASGNDRTFLPGGRCEGIKKADQRWMVEKIDELNERDARCNGFMFANPDPRFDGHELRGNTGEDPTVTLVVIDDRGATGFRDLARIPVDVMPGGDGIPDQVLHVRTRDLGLTPEATQLRLEGTLDNGRAVSSCDAVRVR